MFEGLAAKGFGEKKYKLLTILLATLLKYPKSPLFKGYLFLWITFLVFLFEENLYFLFFCIKIKNLIVKLRVFAFFIKFNMPN